MIIFDAILIVCLLALVFYYWRQFSIDDSAFTREWFLGWAARGLLAPVFVWLLMNVGSLPFMPPLNNSIGQLRNSGAFGHALIAQMVLASIMIAVSWAVLTFGWFMAGLFRRARNNEDLILAMILWSPLLLILLWVFVHGMGWIGSPFAVMIWIWPSTEYALTKADCKVPAPAYSRAIGKIKFGKYAEAEIAIVNELEKCETDFDGWMMLADLYAHQFHDLAEAERTVCELCDEPSTTLSQVSIALHRLADWQLKLRGDPVAARRVLDEICKRMPGTHLASMALVRINQLPHSVAELNEQHQKRKVHMPALSENFDAATEEPASPVTPQEALLSANQLVDKLKEDPNDSASREKLARIFADQLGKLDLAIDQLELLAGIPNQPAEKMAEWLGMLASWQTRHHGENEAARKSLERLVHEFPQSAQAFAAQRRLSLMDREARIRKATPLPKKPSIANAADAA